MRLSAREQEQLLTTLAADVAQRRRDRGLLLNYPEAVAILTSFVLEGARDGRTVAELMTSGRAVLTRADVLPGIAEMVDSVQVEATFADGTKLVTLHGPIFVIPGEIVTVDGEIELNVGRARVTVAVENTGDRPIQVGSHYHFAATNPALSFDRRAAHGYRLDIPAGTSVRFEPGLNLTVDLVAIGGHRVVPGLRLESAGPLDEAR